MTGPRVSGHTLAVIVLVILVACVILGIGSIATKAVLGGNPSRQLAKATPAPLTELQFAAKREFGDQYAGISESADGLVINVKADGTRPVLRFQGFPVREVEYSLGELESYKNRLDELGQELTRRLPSLVSWGVDPKSNSVRISLSQLGPDTERIIFEVAGWGPITLAHSAPAEAV